MCTDPGGPSAFIDHQFHYTHTSSLLTIIGLSLNLLCTKVHMFYVLSYVNYTCTSLILLYTKRSDGHQEAFPSPGIGMTTGHYTWNHNWSQHRSTRWEIPSCQIYNLVAEHITHHHAEIQSPDFVICKHVLWRLDQINHLMEMQHILGEHKQASAIVLSLDGMTRTTAFEIPYDNLIKEKR